MTTAQKVAAQIGTTFPTDIESTEGKHLGWNAQALENLIRREKGAIRTECPDSTDPSWDVSFPDGSRLHVGNPGEKSFRGFVVCGN